jgi:hypothetical protein
MFSLWQVIRASEPEQRIIQRNERCAAAKGWVDLSAGTGKRQLALI